MTSTRYDQIGTSYTRTRRTEPRVAAQILAALGDARRVVNIGAGTGSYEPTDRVVVAGGGGGAKGAGGAAKTTTVVAATASSASDIASLPS